MMDTLVQTVVLEPYNNKIPVRQYSLTNSRPIEFVYYRTLGLEQIYKTALLNVEASDSDNLAAPTAIAAATDFPFIKKSNGSYLISEGNHRIDKPMVIASGTSLHISPGATITFVESGSLLSYGRLEAVGSSQNPITFYTASGDHAAVMISGQEASGSLLEHCQFIGLGAYSQGSISSTAAMTLFDVEAQIRHCGFRNIKAQEALRLERAQAEISDMEFTQIQGTAIRSANSSSKITKVNMREIGRNGLMVRSGFVEGFGYQMQSVMNQALACSGYANVYIWDLHVKDSHQAVLASSHSKLTIKNLNLTNVYRGVEARGNADPVTEVQLGKVKQDAVDRLYIQKQGVALTVDGKSIQAE